MKLERVDGGLSRVESHARRELSQASSAEAPIAIAIDLCSGLGGLSLAAQQVGVAIAAAVDVDDDCLKTFAHNFPDAAVIRSTVGGRKAIAQCMKALDKFSSNHHSLVVLSGPPCQGFSAAGSRDPKDKRNKVLLSVARGIVALNPRCAVVENVQELLDTKHRSRLRDFKKCLEEAGYFSVAVALNSKNYGVPQNRERAFLLITRTKLDEIAVIKRLRDMQIPEIPSRAVLDGLPAAKVRGKRYNDAVDSNRRFPNHLAMRHSGRVKSKIRSIPIGKGPMSYRKLDPDKPANTIFSGHRAPPAHYKYSRSITVREAARLQGFPDSFAVRGSFANQMQQISNAVPPPLARAVLTVALEFSGVLAKRDD